MQHGLETVRREDGRKLPVILEIDMVELDPGRQRLGMTLGQIVDHHGFIAARH